MSHVVAASGRRRQDRVEFGALAVGCITGVGNGGEFIYVVGQVAQHFVEQFYGVGHVAGHQVGHTALSAVNVGAAEFFVAYFDASHLRHHRRPRYEGKRVVGHNHYVAQPNEQSRARHCRAIDDGNRGHHTRTLGYFVGCFAPAVQGRYTFTNFSTRRCHRQHER